ncbi:MAG: ferrous iron transport protein B [Planctomycetaceae bacterium]
MSTTQDKPLTVALIGNPNTGKSTLFNSLAGMQSRVGNFPGVTVEKKIGKVNWNGQTVSLVDLPGTYSLSPRTLDEMVSVDVLLGRQSDVGSPDAVICIVDASNLERNLYLVSQILDMGLPTVLVLNMTDIAKSRGMAIDVPRLREKLGIPVVETEAHRKRGLDQIQDAVLEAVEQSKASLPTRRLFSDEFYAECDTLTQKLADSGNTQIPFYLQERMLLDVHGYVEKEFSESCNFDLPAYLTEARGRLKEAGCRIPAVEAKVRYAWVKELLADIVTRPTEHQTTSSDKIDRIFTHRIAGLVIFCGLMFVVFQAIYTWAGPLMDAIGAGQDAVADLVKGAMPPGAFRSLLTDGVIAGVGGVLVFLPQIALLFLFIAILEDCGYMARAAFLMDRLMTRIGLSGKSFVPLMSSFACAIPGVMATRVIENRRDRMVTMLIAPLMSCSARLPVYLLLIAAFIPEDAYLNGQISLQGLVLFGMSSLGAVIAIPVALLLKKTFFKGETPPFVMELPSYKWPSPRIVLSRVYDRAKAFVVRAGTLIFAATVVIWGCGYFPGDHAEEEKLQSQIEQLQSQEDPNEKQIEQLEEQLKPVQADLLEGSVLGKVGHAIEPAVRPLGWDWKIGVGAIASFPAREVIIATLGTIYSLGGEEDEESEGLKGAIKSAKHADGTPVYNVPVALSIMVFFALCAQCAATLMVIKRETNSWRWPLFTFAYMTGLAYIGSLLTYQIGMLF